MCSSSQFKHDWLNHRQWDEKQFINDGKAFKYVTTIVYVSNLFGEWWSWKVNSRLFNYLTLEIYNLQSFEVEQKLEQRENRIDIIHIIECGWTVSLIQTI